MKQTVLYEEHIKLNAKMVEYAGYWMPVEYGGLAVEHEAVRTNCGVFDVSHMGEILITGKDAKNFVNYLVTSSVPQQELRMIYGLMLYQHGGIVDDLMMYHYHPEKILLVVNASNLEKDFAWVQERIKDQPMWKVQAVDISLTTSQLAIQGPKAKDVMKQLTKVPIDSMQMYDFDEFEVCGKNVLVSRSGYTGEDGFEIYGPNDGILHIFQQMINLGVTPCGLGARDTLRFEANLPLYGHEISESINPLEATLKFSLDFSKEFYGKEALLRVQEQGVSRKIVAIELVEKGIARSDYPVLNKEGEEIGYITTGYLVPIIQKTYGLAMLKEGYWNKGTEVLVQIRKNQVKAVVRDKKFLIKKYVK
jgi:aminomethyltransferase